MRGYKKTFHDVENIDYFIINSFEYFQLIKSENPQYNYQSITSYIDRKNLHEDFIRVFLNVEKLLFCDLKELGIVSESRGRKD